MSLTAAIFIVRYRPLVFKSPLKLLESTIESEINSLKYGDLEDFHIDINILHYALEHYSKYFLHSSTGITISSTQKKKCTLIGLSNDFPAVHQRGWEVTFTDRDYRNAEQVWTEVENLSII